MRRAHRTTSGSAGRRAAFTGSALRRARRDGACVRRRDDCNRAYRRGSNRDGAARALSRDRSRRDRRDAAAPDDRSRDRPRPSALACDAPGTAGGDRAGRARRLAARRTPPRPSRAPASGGPARRRPLRTDRSGRARVRAQQPRPCLSETRRRGDRRTAGRRASLCGWGIGFAMRGCEPYDAEIEAVVFSEAEIQAAVERMAGELGRLCAGESVLLVGVLKGALFLIADLARALGRVEGGPREIRIDFLAVTSYGNSNRSSGEVRLLKDVAESIEGRHVVIVEDIVDNGLTLAYLQGL